MKAPRKTIHCWRCNYVMEELPLERDRRNKIHRYRCLNFSCLHTCWVNR